MNNYAVIAAVVVATLVALGAAAVSAGGNGAQVEYPEQAVYVYEVSVENPADGQAASYTESYVVGTHAGGFDVDVYVDGSIVDSYTAGPEWLAGIRDVSCMEPVGTVAVECMERSFEATEHVYALSGGWGSVASADGVPLLIEESQLWSGGVVHTEVRLLVSIEHPVVASAVD